MTIEIDVKLNGKLFQGKVRPDVEAAIAEEALAKIGERLTRRGTQGSGGRGLGVKRNIVTKEEHELELQIGSTRNFPRTTGVKWAVKNVGIVKSMAPRVIRKTAARIAVE